MSTNEVVKKYLLPKVREQYDRGERIHVLTDAAGNAYSSILLSPAAAAACNRNLSDTDSPYQWTLAGEA